MQLTLYLKKSLFWFFLFINNQNFSSITNTFCNPKTWHIDTSIVAFLKEAPIISSIPIKKD